jgi:excisionase family DNA binding protein
MVTTDDRDWYTVPELEEVAQVCRPTIYSWLNRSWLKYYKMGGRIRITKDEWQRFITRQ